MVPSSRSISIRLFSHRLQRSPRDEGRAKRKKHTAQNLLLTTETRKNLAAKTQRERERERLSQHDDDDDDDKIWKVTMENPAQPPEHTVPSLVNRGSDELIVPATTDSDSNVADARYSFDEKKLETLRKEAPWMKDPKYFKKVALSPSAIMKMVSGMID